MNFKKYYQTIFDSFGYSLDRRDSIDLSSITDAEKSLGVVVPVAFRDYYLIAGHEKRFNQCYNYLITPTKWRVENHQLIFMEENQSTVLWGISTNNLDSDDPPVSQTANCDKLEWYQESSRFSVFIAVMLHYQAVNGAFKYSAHSNDVKKLINGINNEWTCCGTVNNLTAYSRKNQVVCIEPSMGILVAGKTKADLNYIQDDLKIEFT